MMDVVGHLAALVPGQRPLQLLGQGAPSWPPAPLAPRARRGRPAGAAASRTRWCARPGCRPRTSTRSIPRIRSPSQCPGTARSSTSGGRSLIEHHPRDPAAAFAVTPSWLAHRAAGAQIGRQFPLQPAAGLHVQRLVDRLGRHPHLRFVGEVALESASDLLGAVAAFEPGLDLAGAAAGWWPASRPEEPPATVGAGLPDRGAVPAWGRAPFELAADRARAASQPTGDLTHPVTGMVQRRDLLTLDHDR